MAQRILVGTASWADPEFIRSWYPKEVRRDQLLSYYAQFFDMVEYNGSFYSIPAPRQVERWTHLTPPGFVFNVKLHRLLSRHACDVKVLPTQLQRIAETNSRGRVLLNPEIEAAATETFLRAIRPFEDAGKLGALLLQLSPSFSPEAHDLEELDPLLASLQPRRVVVELRNRHWVAEKPERQEMLDYFSRKKVTLVSVDAPSERHLTVMPAMDAVTNPEVGYLRLHGRDADAFIKGKTVPERFDYVYSADEMTEIKERVEGVASQVQQMHVVFNNNRADFAPRNAAQFREVLGQTVKPGVAQQQDLIQ